jgi:hypothetical protein
MGALNHLDLPEWRTAATERWMAYVRDTPALDGVLVQLIDQAIGRLAVQRGVIGTQLAFSRRVRDLLDADDDIH